MHTGNRGTHNCTGFVLAFPADHAKDGGRIKKPRRRWQLTDGAEEANVNQFGDNPYQSPDAPIIRAELVEPKRARKLRTWVAVLIFGLILFAFGFYVFHFVHRAPSLAFFGTGLPMIIFAIVFLLDL